MVRKFWQSLFVSSLFMASPIAFATSLFDMSVQELTGEAEWSGRVEITSLRSIEKNNALFTVVEAQVLEVYKGSDLSSQKVLIELPGGEKNGKSIRVAGLPVFKKKGEYIVFLDQAPALLTTGYASSSVGAQLVGWSAYRVVENIPGYKTVIPASEANRVQRSGMSALSRGSANQERIYDDFVGEIFGAIH